MLSVKECEIAHSARAQGEYPELVAEQAAASRAAPLQTYYEWIKNRGERNATAGQDEGEWNNVSVAKLVAGQS